MFLLSKLKTGMMKLRRMYGNMEDEMPTVERKKNKSVHALLGTPT